MINVRTGEKIVIYSPYIAASEGTLTIAGATFDLLNSRKDPIAENIAVTAFDTPGASVRAWYSLDTLAPPGGGDALARGLYFIKWSIPASATLDSLPRIERPVTAIVIDTV